MKTSRKINLDFIVERMVIAAYALIIIGSIFDHVNGLSVILGYATNLSLATITVALILSYKKLSLPKILISTIALLISIITICTSKDSILGVFALFAVAASQIEFKKIIWFDFWIKTMAIFIVIILFSMGLTDSTTWIVDEDVVNMLGLGNPNTIGIYLLSIALDVLYLLQHQRFLYKFLTTALFFAATFVITGSRGTSVCILLSLVLTLLPYGRIAKSRIATAIFCSIFWVMAIISVLLAMNMSNPAVIEFNKFTSGRVAISSEFLNTYGVNALGNEFTEYRTAEDDTASIYRPLDSAYLQLLVHYGVIATLMTGALFTRKTKTALREGKSAELVGILTFLTLGLVENGLYIVRYNPYILSLLSDQDRPRRTKHQ